jgi:hypothetical protein
MAQFENLDSFADFLSDSYVKDLTVAEESRAFYLDFYNQLKTCETSCPENDKSCVDA